VTITEQSCIYRYLFNRYRLKIDFVMQFYVFCKVLSNSHTTVVS